MRDPRNALKPYLTKETLEARERIAAVHFELEAVRLAITEAAGRGEGSIRLLGQATVELRETKAARSFADWCARNSLRLEWVERVIDRPNGIRVRTAEAVVTWIDELGL